MADIIFAAYGNLIYIADIGSRTVMIRPPTGLAVIDLTMILDDQLWWQQITLAWPVFENHNGCRLLI